MLWTFSVTVTDCGRFTSSPQSEPKAQPADEPGIDVEGGGAVQEFGLPGEHPADFDEARHATRLAAQAEQRPVIADLDFFVLSRRALQVDLIRLDVVFDAAVNPCGA